MTTKVFKGMNVFMSRNLVPPELFDTLHDALKLNGATVFLCCDPTRNAPKDYHVIASPEHEKFEDLQLKGCNLIGPRCLLLCANEKRPLPTQGFTCCLAMDGVNILASGFETKEKADIAKMVTAMGGLLHSKPSLDVNFVIVKNVLAQKYKWALHNIKKPPIVTINWLHQCWKEHHPVPHEPYKVLPFSGLTISVSGIRSEERMDMEKLILQNSGKYSPELTKSCTHLVCNAPEGDKYKVAKRWGHIHIVTRKWFHQSVASRGCLSEESYPVESRTTSPASTLKTGEQHSQGKFRKSQYTQSSLASVSDSETTFSAQATKCELKNVSPNRHSTVREASLLSKDGNDSPSDQRKDDSTFDLCVADDSQSEGDDLYLSECRILIVGVEASKMRMLVNMVRRGGGSRYMSFSEKLTHVIVGNPSENETREVRSLAALGVIFVVSTAWLEECNSKRKEVPVLQRHIAYDILLPKDPAFFNKPTETSMAGAKQEKPSASQHVVNNSIQMTKSPQLEVLLDVKEHAKLKVQSDLKNGTKPLESSIVFNGKLFRFSGSFPEEQRPEIVEWVTKGGGEVVVDQNKKEVHFTVGPHGMLPNLNDSVRSTYISSHWIISCLKDDCLLDIGSHLLYSPLPCRVPLPGFEGCRFCVSQYEPKERKLLRNLCFVLGAKFIEKLSKKVTHLLCKFTDGEKYEAACRWGIQRVTADWIYQCVAQNKVVDPKGFHPKDLTSHDREAGLSSLSQYPTQSVRTTSANDVSELQSQSQGPRNMQTVSSSCSKRARLMESDIKHIEINSVHRKKISEENHVTENPTGVTSVVPDVAAAIEDLLAQTSKIQDQNSQEMSGCHENFMSSNSTILSQRKADSCADPGPSMHWMNRLDKRKDGHNVDAAAAREPCDGFSETQTDSQVVGYEEDLSGRQMIIDRVRSSSNTRTTTDLLTDASRPFLRYN